MCIKNVLLISCLSGCSLFDSLCKIFIFFADGSKLGRTVIFVRSFVQSTIVASLTLFFLPYIGMFVSR